MRKGTLLLLLVLLLIGGCGSQNEQTTSGSSAPPRPSASVAAYAPKSLSVDLNSDGAEDLIKMEKVDESGPQLNVNGRVIRSEECSSTYEFGEEFEIVDIDARDKYKEIAVNGWGLSCNCTMYLRYDGDKLTYLGAVESMPQDVLYHGDGSLNAECSGRVLCTWGYSGVFCLNEQQQLEEVPQELITMHGYCRDDDGWVTVSAPFPLHASRDDSEILLMLRIGDQIRLKITDNKRWILAQTKQGVEGWFQVTGEWFPTRIVGPEPGTFGELDGLNYAD